MTSQPPPPPEQPAEAVPTCYRHPDKETWVRCQRCERPICPDCMRDAAVGFQCPECVADGNKNFRQARSTFGGNVVRTPIVTYAILIINFVVFGLQFLTNDRLTAELVMSPAAVAFDGQYYRLITVALLHQGVLHILFNSWAIWVIGPYLERSFGHTRYVALYLLSAMGGSVLGLWLDPVTSVTLGASGAVFGMFGAVFVVGRRLNLDVRGIAMVIVLNLAITFVLPAFSGLRISWTGHVGGLIMGTLLSLALAYAPKTNRALWQWLAIAGALVLLMALVLVRVPAIVSMAG